jgi:hypothetical protein
MRARSRSRRSRRSSSLPFLLVSLPAGVWVDRLPRRPILVAGDLVAGAPARVRPDRLLARRPDDLAALRRRLSLGIATVFFDVAYQSYLPSLVERHS